jgi:tetratricopeptide (TPR) repeat protein
VSLLLEALKKAELAKQQGAAEQAGVPGLDAGTPAVPPDTPLELSPERPLITRDRLPDITQPLEILSEDLPSASAPKREKAPVSANTESVAAPNARPGSDRPERVAAPASAKLEQDRSSARQIFESKSPNYDPRRPFYYAVGGIGLLAVGIAGYFAYQLFAPAPAYYAGPPSGSAAPPVPPAVAIAPLAKPANSQTPEVASEPGAPAASPTSVTAPPAGAASVPVPPQPPLTTASAAKSSPARSAATSPARAARPAPSAGPSEPEAAAVGTPAPPGAAVRVTRGGPRVDPNVERGWEALQAGNLAQARIEYMQALRANPRDRDALLGLAALDVRAQDIATAEARYSRVLELDPRDAYAQAQLLSLRGPADPVQTESRLKSLAAQQPDATVLSFSLGNQYASQRRWAEAQQAYFTAMSGDPDNADYAFNLAVSLDHLRQPKLALEYYLRALALAGSRSVGFNPAQVEARVRELQRQ